MSCLQLLGGVYAPLQVVAWGAMLTRYAQDGGLAAAARATFDGSRPCPMCVAISEAKQADADKPDTPAKQVEKPRLQWLEWALVGGVDLPVVRVVELQSCWKGGAMWVPTTVDGEPPVPPPRVPGAWATTMAAAMFGSCV